MTQAPSKDGKEQSFVLIKRELLHEWIKTCMRSRTGRLKIIHYDFNKLVAVSAFWTIFSKGTLFSLDKTIYLCMGGYIMVFLVAFLGLFFLGDPINFAEESLAPILDVSNSVQRFCPFLFGMFVSVVLSRWWAMRTTCVGAIMNHLVNVSSLLVGLGARTLPKEEDWAKFREMHSSVVKYGLASLSCIANEARGEFENLGDLVKTGLLTESEKVILEEAPNQAIALWCWVSALSSEVLEMMKIPAPTHNMLFTDIRMALEGVHSVQEYILTQLPFPYVHMITLLVNANNTVIAAASGLKCAIAATQGLPVVCIMEVVQMLLVPLLYQGLLQICVFLSNPMGDDIIDFPIREFQLSAADACQGHLDTTRKLYELRWKMNQAPMPNAHVIPDLETSQLEPVHDPDAPKSPAQQRLSSIMPTAAAVTPDVLDRNRAELMSNIDQRFEELAHRIGVAFERGLASRTASQGAAVRNLLTATEDRLDRMHKQATKEMNKDGMSAWRSGICMSPGLPDPNDKYRKKLEEYPRSQVKLDPT